MAIKKYAGDKITGLSSDTKPTNVPDGATFYETDTRKSFIRASSTWVQLVGGKRVTSETSSATPTINTDICDIHRVTALAVNVTSMTTNLSGTPTSMQVLGIEVTPTATRTVTWGASFENGAEYTLPTEFNGTSARMYLFYWNPVTSKWRYAGVV